MTENKLEDLWVPCLPPYPECSEFERITDECLKSWQTPVEEDRVQKGNHLKICTTKYCRHMRKNWKVESMLQKYVV